MTDAQKPDRVYLVWCDNSCTKVCATEEIAHAVVEEYKREHRGYARWSVTEFVVINSIEEALQP